VPAGTTILISPLIGLKDDAVEGLSAQRIGEPNTEANDILFM